MRASRLRPSAALLVFLVTTGCGGARPTPSRAVERTDEALTLAFRPADGARYVHAVRERNGRGPGDDHTFGSLSTWRRLEDGEWMLDQRGFWLWTPDGEVTDDHRALGRARVTRRLAANGGSSWLAHVEPANPTSESLVQHLALAGLWHAFAAHPVRPGATWRDEASVGSATSVNVRRTTLTFDAIEASDEGPVACLSLAGSWHETFAAGRRSRWLFSGTSRVLLADGITSHTELRVAQGDTDAARSRGDAANGEGTYREVVVDITPR